MSRISRVLTAFLLVFFAAGPISAAAAPTPQVAQAQTTASISGAITDATGAPISGATVALGGPTSRSMSTDATGQFAFTGVAPGIYSITASKPGFESASLTDYAVTAGAKAIGLTVTLVAATLSSLHEIGRVSVNRARSTFNSTPASVAVIAPQAFEDQASPQVMRILDQTPGIVTGHPATTAAGASPGAITFPNIRGGLAFETASLIDGHPVSVGSFGDYVTTFLNSYLLSGVELIKGPGASAPEVNYAIGGTVNFRTLDPTSKPQGQLVLGTDGYGGQFSNYRFTGSTRSQKFGWALDYAINGSPGPLANTAGYLPIGSGNIVNGLTVGGSTTNAIPNPAVQNNPFAGSNTAFACCFPVNTTYTNHSELAKIRYKFSDSTVVTASYLGSQAWSDQNGNHAGLISSLFTPATGYTGSVAANTQIPLLQNQFAPPNEFEYNNEPIFQVDLRTTYKKDTILARYYAASINRLQYDGGGPCASNTCSYTTNYNVYGSIIPAGTTTPVIFNGQSVPVTTNGVFFRSTEEDKLHGASVEYDHYAGPNVYSLAIDNTTSTTNSYSLNGSSPISISIPPGEHQRFTTVLLRGIFNINDKWAATLSNYFNSYAFINSADGGTTYVGSNYSHYDGRLGVTFRPNPNISYRASAGSAIAPPYPFLMNASSTIPIADRTNSFATNTLNAALTLKPETSFGYDVGGDLRFGPGTLTTLSIDGFLTNLKNQYITSTYANGNVTVAPSGGTGAAIPLPLFTKQNINLANARYQGIELSLRRDPKVGFGFVASGALLRGYPYNINPSFYATGSSGLPTSNLAVLPGINFLTNCASGGAGSCNAVSNQSIPYSTGFGELHFRSEKGGLVTFGETYYGPNNSYNVPAFFIANGSVRLSVADQRTSFQVSVDNIFNANQSKYILQFQGVGIPLANGKIGLTNANGPGPRLARLVLTRNFGAR